MGRAARGTLEAGWTATSYEMLSSFKFYKTPGVQAGNSGLMQCLENAFIRLKTDSSDSFSGWGCSITLPQVHHLSRRVKYHHSPSPSQHNTNYVIELRLQLICAPAPCLSAYSDEQPELDSVGGNRPSNKLQFSQPRAGNSSS